MERAAGPVELEQRSDLRGDVERDPVVDCAVLAPGQARVALGLEPLERADRLIPRRPTDKHIPMPNEVRPRAVPDVRDVIAGRRIERLDDHRAAEPAWIDRALHEHSRRVREIPAAQPPGARRARSDDPNPGRAVLVELRPPRDEVLVLLVPRRHPWLRAKPVGDKREVRRRRRDRARHRRRWHRQAAGPVGPARAASRNPQARARHNQASQKPPTTDVRHRTHDAILDTNTQTRRSQRGDVQRDHWRTPGRLQRGTCSGAAPCCLGTGRPTTTDASAKTASPSRLAERPLTPNHVRAAVRPSAKRRCRRPVRSPRDRIRRPAGAKRTSPSDGVVGVLLARVGPATGDLLAGAGPVTVE